MPVTQVIDQLNALVGDQLIGKDRGCPSCGGQLSLKFSSRLRGAPFVGCSSYPSAQAPAAFHLPLLCCIRPHPTRRLSL